MLIFLLSTPLNFLLTEGRITHATTFHCRRRIDKPSHARFDIPEALHLHQATDEELQVAAREEQAYCIGRVEPTEQERITP